jgi:hypothetical protein
VAVGIPCILNLLQCASRRGLGTLSGAANRMAVITLHG